MKNFTLKSIFTVLALMLAVTSYSQDRTCGMMEYMEEMKKDPVLLKEYQENQRKFKAELAKRLRSDFQARGGATIEIPVAVHFMTGNTNDRACLEALAQRQIDVLNADYSASNTDISTWNAIADNYVGLDAPGVANITFCLATSNHPAAVPQLVEGQPAVTIGYNFANGSGFPETDVNFQGYMNFVVKPLNGLLGYSPLGGSVANGAAVVIDPSTFGTGGGCANGIAPSSPYNLGRTTTHELGHFYSLRHTFNGDATQGDPNAVCGSGTGDGIADTPEVASATYGCPSNPTPFACNAPERRLTMNYMDYVNDACMYMFTPGQANQVDAYIAGVLASDFKPNVCGAANPGFALTANDSPVYSCPDIDTEAVFNLSYTTILDFNETTTFSATGLPANATVNFTPSSLSNDGDFVMTVGGIGATALGVYTITVTGTSNSVVETVDVVLNNNCTEIDCIPFTPDPMNFPLSITDGLAGGGVGQPLAQLTINVPNSSIIDGMTVSVDLTHTYTQDLILQLLHPDGATFVNLLGQDCGSENLNNTLITFDDEGSTITCPGGDDDIIPSGTYAPSDPLSTFDGLDAQGDWTLFVADVFEGDIGQLNSLTLSICSEQQLSVDKFSLDSFAIFPNPNNGEFTIKLNSNSGNDIKVDVFDIRGRRIFNNIYANTGDFSETVNLNSVQSGMYLVTVNDGNNEITKRIIVE